MPLDLKPFQHAGAMHLASQQRAALCDDLGLGKTPQAIMAAKRVNAQRILMVAPLSTLPGLAGEIRRWWPDAPPVRIYRRADDALPTTPAWTLIPWTDLTRRRAGILAGSRYDLIIGDEAHTAKNLDGSKTAQAWYGYQKQPGVAAHAARSWALTATPMPNGRPIELYPLIMWAGGLQVPAHRGRYLHRYCSRVTEHGSDLLGAHNLDEIHAYLKRSGWFLRREAADVPGELPTLRRIAVPIDLPPSPTPGPIPGDSLPEDLGEDRMPTMEEWSAYRAALGWRKGVAAITWIDEWLETNPNRAIVIFCHHRETAGMLAYHFGIKSLTGDDTPAIRQQAVEAFAKPDGPRVFVATMGACGTGINGLHRRTTVCAFVEFDCVPAVHHQAEGRIRRIGGIEGGAIAYYLHGAGSLLDAHMARLYTRKTGWIESTLPAELSEDARALLA